MSFSDRDYQRLSDAIVSDFCKCQQPLREGVVKVADAHQMNVHETKRLIEAVNTKTHLYLFKEASDNKYVEFELAEPREVLSELFGTVPAEQGDVRPGEKVGHLNSLYVDLPNEYLTPLEKTASSSVDDKNETTRLKPEKVVPRLNKVAEELDYRLINAKRKYDEEVEKLASHFTSIYSDSLETLSKHANTLCPKRGHLYVRDACNLINKEEPTVQKVASVVQDKSWHQNLKAVDEAYENLVKISEAQKWFRSKVENLLYV